ncbi:hypothetical protein GGF40_003262 [Coemansia sp. RSA 1286]|nr:hypothetical protein GGF40_003262 [Coemansia sp. RSA 1286]
MYSMVSPQPRWRPFSNPAPLGNSGFAVSTFVSALHTGAIGIASGAPPNIVVGLALFYGGMAQIIAGAWAFASNNGFGAVVFTSYGCYWLSYAATLVPAFGIGQALGSVSADVRAQSLGIFYLVWVLQTFIFVLGSMRSNWGTLTLLVFLLATNVLTCIGKWTQSEGVLHASGYVGLLTAVVAWYNVAVDMLNKETFYVDLPNPSIGATNALPEAIEPAVHTPFFHDAAHFHKPDHHHHAHPHAAPHKLEGRTPGNHFEFVSPVPGVGSAAHPLGDVGSRVRSGSMHSVGFDDHINVRTIVADVALPPPPSSPPQPASSASGQSDSTTACKSAVSSDEITQIV